MSEQNQKKPGPIKRIKKWWNGLTNDQKWACVCGIYLLDGLLIGGDIASMVKNKKMEKQCKIYTAAGYIQGRMDAFQEIAVKSQNNNNVKNK